MLPTIKLRSSGEAVKVAQILTGFGDINGDFDTLFETHVKSWQETKGLTPDGKIGARSWEAMIADAPTVSAKTLRKGKYAMAVQLLIGVTPDGIFGAKTKAAVVAYQSAAGLSADGIVGQKTWTALITGDTAKDKDVPATGGKVLNTCVHYLQWDKRWKKIMYSSHNDKNQTIGNSGCGPTSAAMICATWIDPTLTPVELCELSTGWGTRTYSSGTAWSFFGKVAEKYGFSKFVRSSNLATVLAAVRAGALVVCSMNSNDGCFWTKGGHFITLIGCDEKYIYANDPNKSAHPRKQAQSKFKSCLKGAFIYYK